MRKYEEVREFCIRKLAQILYDCVECSDADRAELDWLTAEQFVDGNRRFVNGVHDSAVHFHDYETFERVHGRSVWDELYQPLRKKMGLSSRPPRPHYTYLLFG